MAISFVGGVQGGRAGSTSTTTKSLSGTLSGGSNTSPSAGDLVVVLCAAGADTTAAPSQDISGNNNGAYTGLTAQSSVVATTYDSYHRVSYKIQGGTVDTSITIPSSGSARNAQRWRVMVFRGVDSTTPMDATATYAVGTGTGRPNPAAILPVTAGAWICAFYASAAGKGAAYTAPTDFATNWLGGTTADTADCMTGSGYYTGWTSGSYDPAAITAGGTTNAADTWTATTIALRPAPAITTIVAQESNYSLTAENGVVNTDAFILAESRIGYDAWAYDTYQYDSDPSVRAAIVTAQESNLTLTADNGIVVPTTVIAASESSYALRADNGTVQQTTTVSPAESTLSLTADNGSVATSTTLTAQESAYSFVADNGTLEVITNISAQESAYALTADNGTVESLVSSEVTAQESNFTLTADNATIETVSIIQPSEGVYTLTAENGTLEVISVIQPAEGNYSLTADTAGIQTTTTLSPAESTYSLTADNATIVIGAAITATESSFDLSADNGEIVQTTEITADEGSFNLTADNARISDGSEQPLTKIITPQGEYIKIWRKNGRYAYDYYGGLYILSVDNRVLEKV